MTYLADANVLIARVVNTHQFHGVAKSWLESVGRFAMCPVTEGALVRFLKWQYPDDASTSTEMLSLLSTFRGYEFWPDDLSYRAVELGNIKGHKQVTDAYLVALARSKGGKLATFDEALAALYLDVELVRP